MTGTNNWQYGIDPQLAQQMQYGTSSAGSSWRGISGLGGNTAGGGNSEWGGLYKKNLELQNQSMQQQMNNSSFGANMNTFGSVMDGLNSLGQLWGSYQSNKLAKNQFKLQKSVTNTNLMNQIQSYNTALRDRINARTHMEGKDQSSADKYYDENKLKRH